MTSLLIIIYIAFISLGLPDSMMGAAWPAMHVDLGAPVAMAGYLSMTVSAGTIVSSLSSNKLISRFGTGKVMVVSVLMTAIGLLGITFVPNAWLIFLCAIPLGLGGGSVDAALNNFVALHYESRHMSWLHCFWGVGATVSPSVISMLLSAGISWRTGYGTISVLQFIFVGVLFATLPLWKKVAVSEGIEQEETAYVSNREALRIPYAVPALMSFLFFCAMETTGGLWAATFLSTTRGMSAATAAVWASLYYGGITVGRLINGFITRKFSNVTLMRTGQIICLLGAIITALPLSPIVAAIGVGVIGFGSAPIYPCTIHETPRRFGAKNSQALIGLQMAFAYTGSTLMPPLFGALASVTTMNLYPWYLMVCILGMIVTSEYVAAKTAR